MGKLLQKIVPKVNLDDMLTQLPSWFQYSQNYSVILVSKNVTYIYVLSASFNKANVSFFYEPM